LPIIVVVTNILPKTGDGDQSVKTPALNQVRAFFLENFRIAAINQ